MIDDMKKMPKLEMHIHIEGTFDEDTVCSLAETQGIALPRPKESIFAFTGLSDFLSLLDWICSLVRDSDTARQIAYRFAEYAKEQGIIYTEVIVNPSHWKNIRTEELIQGILDGFDEAYGNGLPDCRLLVSIRREQDFLSASNTVNWVLSHRHPRLAGMSVDGNEELSADSKKRFSPLVRKCRDSGLGIAVHAGESSGPEGITEALDVLGADRIDHGVRAIESPGLLRRLREDRIPLDVCFTSNIVGGLYTAENHPFKALYDMGILINASTDDPQLLQLPLCTELERIATQYGWDIRNLLSLQYNALDAAFCNDDDKRTIRNKLDEFKALLEKE